MDDSQLNQTSPTSGTTGQILPPGAKETFDDKEENSISSALDAKDNSETVAEEFEEINKENY